MLSANLISWALLGSHSIVPVPLNIKRARAGAEHAARARSRNGIRRTVMPTSGHVSGLLTTARQITRHDPGKAGAGRLPQWASGRVSGRVGPRVHEKSFLRRISS